MAELEKAARNYLLNEHISPINDILHKCDLKVEMQYHTDIENAFKAGANWQYEQFEKERLKHCDEMTAGQAQMESDFVVQHLKNFNRTPTFIDAIEYGRESMREKLSKLKELADKMYYAAQYFTTDASKLRKAMRDYWHYVVYELKEDRQ